MNIQENSQSNNVINNEITESVDDVNYISYLSDQVQNLE